MHEITQAEWWNCGDDGIHATLREFSQTLAFVERRNQKMYNQYKKLMVLIGFLPVFCENSWGRACKGDDPRFRHPAVPPFHSVTLLMAGWGERKLTWPRLYHIKM